MHMPITHVPDCKSRVLAPKFKTRLVIYEQETSSDTDIYHFAMDLLKQTQRLSKDLSEINDPDIQRRLLLSQLQKNPGIRQ